ncbi:hypothetical protein SCLCIDRAFT_1214541 [Scleroderma citrinum Foug A]|uniref:Uncharacterized protein n=1 Tax=Scleroderma citrinum Foug A TaxID=1036808 RepID=A0A0C2ZN38_9AGAM|nr:hypothetical protein SCLCIDRAFT_1214541 [Scleroderma citrinum Foug A]
MPSAPASTQRSRSLLLHYQCHIAYSTNPTWPCHLYSTKLNHSGFSPGMMHIIITRGNVLSKLI